MHRGLQGGCVCRCTITRRLHVKSSLDGLCQFSFFLLRLKCRCCQCIISHHLVRKLQNPLGSWVAHVLNRFGFMSLTLRYCCELCCSGFCILICPWCISSSTPFSQLFCWKVNICFLFELFPHFICDFWLLYLPQELLPWKRNGSSVSDDVWMLWFSANLALFLPTPMNWTTGVKTLQSLKSPNFLNDVQCVWVQCRMTVYCKLCLGRRSW